MARTAFNKALVYSGASYTVPASKYFVGNVFPGTNQYLDGYPVGLILSLNGVLFSMATQFSGARVGPIVMNAGDVLVNAGGYGPDAVGPSPTRSSYATATVCGEVFDASTVKVPFSSSIIPGSSTYTVPAGKIAVFNAFAGVPAGVGVAYPTYLRMNSGNIVPLRKPFDITAPYGRLPLPAIEGPLMANAGDIVDCIADSSPAVGFLLNGFLYPA